MKLGVAGVVSFYLLNVVSSELQASTYPCLGCDIDSAQEIINRGLENQYRRIQEQNVTFAQFLDGTNKGYTLDEILQANPPGSAICSIDDAIQVINQGLAKNYKQGQVQGQCVSFADFLSQMAGKGKTTTTRYLPRPVVDYAVQRFADVGIYDPDWEWIDWFAHEEYVEDQNLVLAMLLCANHGFFNVFPEDLFFLSHDLRHFHDRLHDLDDRMRRRGDRRGDPRAINLAPLVKKAGTKSDPTQLKKTSKELMTKVKSADPSKWKEKTPATNALTGAVGAKTALPTTERKPASIPSLEKSTGKGSPHATEAIHPSPESMKGLTKERRPVPLRSLEKSRERIKSHTADGFQPPVKVYSAPRLERGPAVKPFSMPRSQGSSEGFSHRGGGSLGGGGSHGGGSSGRKH